MPREQMFDWWHNSSSQSCCCQNIGGKIDTTKILPSKIAHLCKISAYFFHTKGSKDSYYSLVSNIPLSQKIGCWHWHPGSSDLGQKCVNVPPLCHLQKPKSFQFSEDLN